MHFGNGRAVRNLFGEMKMLLARRLMKSHAQESLTIDKETLVTFSLEDVPVPNLSESLFNLNPLSKDDSKYRASEMIINIDPTLPE
jgi:hypothetical protein